ncbi:DNA adenine methylase [Methylobacterium radiodurans]|uniref:site-specific DNA-methyltransferase (adenine-specific) n=1 Tax=Methylobacterium radiodurans TaxID=2202828 RepID=A0A2U8VQJ3_9HYPH|nr:DNA adenine methylase [Methylobacterium radiodurans]AWN35954.1 adenine methyltransferase [Methylobacterium radiodurans]
MKYMGSKKAMLLNGLGETISEEISKSTRFVDLFSGSGAVSWHVSSRWQVPVLACDLQHYAVSLAAGVLTRTSPIQSTKTFDRWIKKAEDKVLSCPHYKDILGNHMLLLEDANISCIAEGARGIAAREGNNSIMRSYGGYYFSPMQCLWLDALRQALPYRTQDRALALAALICTASRLAASPGHTAQPLKANETAGVYLRRAWKRDLLSVLKYNLIEVGRKSALKRGAAFQGDALEVARTLQDGDLVFIDPPYSAVQYSRFYHVLETISSGMNFVPEGSGRYPPVSGRPVSAYSLKTKSRTAIVDLFRSLSSVGANAIVTFPEELASNGLSGRDVEEAADAYFVIKKRSVSTSFSTLGGTRANRQARKVGGELILALQAKGR